MMIKPEEALTKWCCVNTNERCRGTSCMGWRIDYMVNRDAKTLSDLQSKPLKESGLGYCGLAYCDR